MLTSDELLAVKEVPGTLAVIGGGVIGTEMGQSFASLGSKVIIIEMMDRIVPTLDQEVSAELLRHMKKKGLR